MDISSLKKFKILSYALNDALEMNDNGKYSVIIIFSIIKKEYYVLYRADFDELREDLEKQKIIIKGEIEGKEERKEKELKKEDIFNESFFIEGKKVGMNVADFRDLLLRVKNQDLSIKELREILFNVKKDDFDIGDVLEFVE